MKVDEEVSGNGAGTIVLHTLTGASVVRVVGDADLSMAAGLRATLDTALMAAPWIIVDLSGAGAIDSVGIGVLLAVRAAARRQSGDLLLAAPPPFFRSVLRAARLTSAFATFDTVPQAMTAALAGRAAQTATGAATAA